MIFDIAFNITDKAFDKDRTSVVERCRVAGVLPFLVGLDTRSSLECISYAERYNLPCYAGVHPTSNNESISGLDEALKNRLVVALGECGLDFDRLHFKNKKQQIRLFRKQLEIGHKTYFLHSRGCHREFMEVISDYSFGGVVHSFTGELEEAADYIKKGLFIGINGCSLKTQRAVEVAHDLPLESLVLETDAPYCKIRRSSPGYKYIKAGSYEKNLMKRNEPCSVKQVAEALAETKECTFQDIVAATNKNVVRLFGESLFSVSEQFFGHWSQEA